MAAESEYIQFRTLIGKRIVMEYRGKKMNAFVIKELLQPVKVDGVEMYKGLVEYDLPNMAGAYPILLFEAKTLYEFVEKGISMCPMVHGVGLYYYLESESE